MPNVLLRQHKRPDELFLGSMTVRTFLELLSKYIDFIQSILLKIGLARFSSLNVRVKEGGGVAERLARVESVHTRLTGVVETMEELKKVEEENKTALAQALEDLATVSRQRSSGPEVEAVARLGNIDMEAVRRFAGALPEEQVKRQRIIGFLAGIITTVAFVMLAMVLFEALG
jgi:hypothetical protein